MSRVEKQMIIVTRFEIVMDYGIPSRENVVWNISNATFHPPLVLGYVGTKQMDVNQSHGCLRCYFAPAEPTGVHGIDAISYHGVAKKQVGFSDSIRDSVSGWSDTFRARGFHSLLNRVDAEI